MSSTSEAKNRNEKEAPTTKTEQNSRSTFDPLLNSTSRYPVAEAIQMRSLEGTAQEKRSTKEIGAEEKVDKDDNNKSTIGSHSTTFSHVEGVSSGDWTTLLTVRFKPSLRFQKFLKLRCPLRIPRDAY